jgi:hypothetical protein
MASGAKNPTSAGECSRRSYFVIRSKKLVLDGLLLCALPARAPLPGLGGPRGTRDHGVTATPGPRRGAGAEPGRVRRDAVSR